MALKLSSPHTKRPKKSVRSTRIVVGLFLVAVIIAGILIGRHLLLQNNTSQIDPAEQAQNNQKKAQTIDNGGVPTNPSDKKSQQTDTTYTPPSTDSGIAITPSRSGDTVTISTKLTGYSDGSCKLSIKNGAKTFTQEADVIYAPNYSTCAGFSVPVSQLGSGSWQITLDVTSGGNLTSKSTAFEVS